jgi:phosphate transport system substrate-binding protein
MKSSLIPSVLVAALLSGALLQQACIPIEQSGSGRATPGTRVAASDPLAGLPVYRSSRPVAGRIRSTGSDTMDLLVAKWEADFKAMNPELRVVHEGRGSSTAIPALLEGRAEIGPMSRAPLPAEEQRFQQQKGYAPTVVRVATDALAIYVHPDNPLAQSGLTLAQLDAIFSSGRKRGHPKEVTTWGDLGLTGEWATRPISLYSRNRASGTFGWFRDTVLQKGDFKVNARELQGSADVVAAVASDRAGIGYSGYGYKSALVAAVPVFPENQGVPVAPSADTAMSGAYPLARPLFLALDVPTGQPMPTAVREFVTFVLSRQGAQIVLTEGYFPLDAKAAAAERAKLKR